MFVSVVSFIICDWDIKKREFFFGWNFNIFEVFYIVVVINFVLNLNWFGLFEDENCVNENLFLMDIGGNKIIISWKDKLLGFLC